MAAILSLLFLIPFLKCNKLKWFTTLYTAILLIIVWIRPTLHELGYCTTGKYFFKYYSDIQFIFIVLAAILLTGWFRIASIISSILFSIYSLYIYVYWGQISLEYYDVIAISIIYLHLGIITYSEQSFIKNVIVAVFIWFVTFGQGRYL